MNSITLTKNDIARFWNKVMIGNPDECWEWQGSDNGLGYGKFPVSRNGKTYQKYAHRVAYEQKHGEIKNGLFVCHRCDNPKCVNPNHMFLGTQTDNMKDMARKGRTGKGAFGERQHSAKLTRHDVLSIREMLKTKSLAEIGRTYGVSATAVLLIKKGKNWSWLK